MLTPAGQQGSFPDQIFSGGRSNVNLWTALVCIVEIFTRHNRAAYGLLSIALILAFLSLVAVSIWGSGNPIGAAISAGLMARLLLRHKP